MVLFFYFRKCLFTCIAQWAFKPFRQFIKLCARINL